MKRIIKKILNRIGIDVVRYTPREEIILYELEHKASECINIVKNNTMLSKRVW